MPGGGIMPPRSFRMARSQTMAFFSGCERSIVSKVRLAILVFALWQVTQYLLTRALLASAGPLEFAVCCGAATSADAAHAAINRDRMIGTAAPYSIWSRGRILDDSAQFASVR